ncbi:hypothetical protein [Nocardia mexicana]|uniref:Uncharacterized protein n=1 Tax=Nocardia mexicana TaxID=279262 RepID=A0A370H9I3_9NOCA|nr:hypothetical protein [Nocardia mexicana]RDI53335.1 hypothetical protein DFR68_103724 [Nocardia mexicana]
MAGNLQTLARRWCEYTNEPYCQARQALLAIPHSGRLLPDAPLGQARFEAAVLRSVGYGISPQCGGRGSTQPFGIQSVSPGCCGLEIRLSSNPKSANDFLYRISPILADGGVNGIAGLRVTFSRRGAVLSMYETDGTVLVRGVDEKSWMAALVAVSGKRTLRNYLGGTDALHEVEEAEMCLYRRMPSRSGLDSAEVLLSGIIRRAHMFRCRDLRFLDLWTDVSVDDAVIKIEWAGDLTHHQVISRAIDKRFGLPLKVVDKKCFCDHCTSDTYEIHLLDTVDERVHVYLRRSSLYDDELPPRPTGRCLSPGFSLGRDVELGRGACHAI